TVLRLRCEGVETFGNPFLSLLAPFFFAIIQVPLVTESDYAIIAGSRSDLASGFGIGNGLSALDKLIAHLWLCNLYLLALEVPNKHGTLIIALLVSQFLCLGQLLSILRRAN